MGEPESNEKKTQQKEEVAFDEFSGSSMYVLEESRTKFADK